MEVNILKNCSIWTNYSILGSLKLCEDILELIFFIKWYYRDLHSTFFTHLNFWNSKYSIDKKFSEEVVALFLHTTELHREDRIIFYFKSKI